MKTEKNKYSLAIRCVLEYLDHLNISYKMDKTSIIYDAGDDDWIMLSYDTINKEGITKTNLSINANINKIKLMSYDYEWDMED